MRQRDDLLPPRVADERPGLASLLRRVLRRLTDEEYERLIDELGPHPPLDGLWRATGCAAEYAFAVTEQDLAETESQRSGPTFPPLLADGCFPFVAMGRRGGRTLALALAFAAEGAAGSVSVPVCRDIVRETAGLRFVPRREGVFLAARFLAHARGRAVRPEDLIDVLSIVLTPSVRGALAGLGAQVKALDEAATRLLAEVGRSSMARLREVAIVPPGLLSLPATWNVREVRATCGIRLIRDDEVELPDLDALWLVARYLLHARIEGTPTAPRGLPKARVPSARTVLRRYAEKGWEAVFAGALRACGWEPAIVEADGCTAAELVRHGLHTTGQETPSAPPEHPAVVREDDPVERARAEYAGIRDALAPKIVRPGIIDRLALIAFAHRRGVGQRLLLSGRSGAGKSYIARTIAEVVGAPVFIQDATGLTETGYRGLNVPDLIDAMYKSAGSDKAALRRSVLVLDEIDKIRIAQGVDGVSLDKRWGMQSCVLGLLQGGTPIVGGAGSLVVDTSKMLIVCAGAFSDAPWAEVRAPTTADLVEYGLIRELAERLRDRVFLPPRTVHELVQVMQHSDESVDAVVSPLARELGIELRVLKSTYVVVARMIAEERGGMGLRSGHQVLVTAAQRAILRALEEGGDPVAIVTPDDIDLMPQARL